MAASYRREHDLLGERDVPADAYWGVHTLRALENFPISGQTIGSYPDLVRALALVKQAAAQANRELGLLDAERCGAIVAACQEIAAGRLHDQFVVDVIQGGAGTSTNMNINEVVANRALELLGRPQGRLSPSAPDRTRQSFAKHERCVSDRRESSHQLRHCTPAGGHGGAARRVCGEG